MVTDIPVLTAEAVFAVMYDITHSPTFYLILATMLLEFGSGMGKAIISGVYSSSTGLNGTIKHSLVLVFMLILKFFGRVFGLYPTAFSMIMVMLSTYWASIFENIDAMGFNIPESIRSRFKQTGDKHENELELGPNDKIIIKRDEGKKGIDR